MTKRRSSVWSTGQTAVLVVMLAIGATLIRLGGQWAMPIMSVTGAYVLGFMARRALMLVGSSILIVTYAAGIRDMGWNIPMSVVSMMAYAGILLRMWWTNPNWH